MSETVPGLNLPFVAHCPAAVLDHEQRLAFLQPKSLSAAPCAVVAISEAMRGLGEQPGIVRPVEEVPKYRELLIDFVDSGYVAPYRHAGDQLDVMALRQEREAAYRV